ncbi:DUF1361 domain-containing protein [Alkalinema pantanalense CENA528]|uniref:DUF1361 domain-containing protein n=1 Tax=Alkalinema pantanalense TaxID=1620705 RepID=UPI003D6E87DE
MEPSLIKFLLWDTFHIIYVNRTWMGWNLFLAIIPLVLSVVLFRGDESGAAIVRRSQVTQERLVSQRIPSQTRTRNDRPAVFWQQYTAKLSTLIQSHSGLWWVGFIIFVAFLPNAPYILTDVIHLVEAIRGESSIWRSSLVFIPVFLGFMFLGFESYVLSLINLGFYLHKSGRGRYIYCAELILHFMSAIGIYLGRFVRFNSWDIVTNPDGLVSYVLDDLLRHQPILAIGYTFIIITILYLPMKEVTLAMIAYRQLNRSKKFHDRLILE